MERAVHLHDTAGRDVALDYYNTMQSVDGDWYVFVIDENNEIIVHPTVPANIGKDAQERTDITGYNYGADLITATEEGQWVDYVHFNPATEEHERKHSWVVRHDGLIYGSGWYERDVEVATKSNPAAYTKAFVEDAIRRYEADGHDATIAYYNTMESVDGDWYMFIGDENDVLISHATVPTLVGQQNRDITGPDGYPIGLAVATAANEDGSWVDYVYLNPNTGNVEQKHSWVVRHDGMIFGSGWYEEGPSKSSEPSVYTKLFVERAVHLHDTAGRDVALDYYNTMQSVDGDWYVFIFEDDILIVHPTVPANIGEDLKGPLAGC